MTISKTPFSLALLGGLCIVVLLFTSWAAALLAKEPPLQNIAFGSSMMPPEALWLTEDQSLIIASGACAEGSIDLCGMIVGINDPKLIIWATEICGLPMFWDLKPDAEQNDWRHGRILDLVTLKEHPLIANFSSGVLVLHVRGQAPIHWQETSLLPVGCDF